MTARWRAVIVDDEPPARRSLHLLLGSYPDVEVVAECDHAAAAIEAIRATKPDLLFIDVQMPGATGLDVIDAAGRDAVPIVVFTTAYAEYALAAFEAHAFDYLLKPWTDERFHGVMARVRRALTTAAAAAVVATTDGVTRVLTIRDGGRLHRIPVAEIAWIEAEDYCTRIHAGDRRPLVRRSMQSLAEELAPAGFLRVHRSAIVNLSRVREVTPLATGDADARLADGTIVRISRTYRDSLQRHLASLQR
jgi:two-component system LytT family response regulator